MYGSLKTKIPYKQRVIKLSILSKDAKVHPFPSLCIQSDGAAARLFRVETSAEDFHLTRSLCFNNASSRICDSLVLCFV